MGVEYRALNIAGAYQRVSCVFDIKEATPYQLARGLPQENIVSVQCVQA
jgi:hypothetical protein